MDSPLSKRSLKRVTEGSHWRESKQVLFPMISVLRTACSFAHSCFPGTDKEQRVLEKWHTKEESILDLLKLNVPWQVPLFYFCIIGDCRYFCEKGPDQLSLFSLNNFSWKASVYYKYNHQDNYQRYSSRSNTKCALKPSSRVCCCC